MIQLRAKWASDLAKSGEIRDPRSLGLAVEMNQIYLEYLDELELSELRICEDVTVKVDGQTVKFENEDKFSDWLVEHL